MVVGHNFFLKMIIIIITAYRKPYISKPFDQNKDNHSTISNNEPPDWIVQFNPVPDYSFKIILFSKNAYFGSLFVNIFYECFIFFFLFSLVAVSSVENFKIHPNNICCRCSMVCFFLDLHPYSSCCCCCLASNLFFSYTTNKQWKNLEQAKKK